MSQFSTRQLITSLAPELLVAASEVTSPTGVILDKPAILVALIGTGVGSNQRMGLYDGEGNEDNLLFQAGQLVITDTQRVFCPGNIKFSTDIRANLFGNLRHLRYTLFYMEV
jgi:hypothetical protein